MLAQIIFTHFIFTKFHTYGLHLIGYTSGVQKFMENGRGNSGTKNFENSCIQV